MKGQSLFSGKNKKILSGYPLIWSHGKGLFFMTCFIYLTAYYNLKV